MTQRHRNGPLVKNNFNHKVEMHDVTLHVFPSKTERLFKKGLLITHVSLERITPLYEQRPKPYQDPQNKREMSQRKSHHP